MRRLFKIDYFGVNIFYIYLYDGFCFRFFYLIKYIVFLVVLVFGGYFDIWYFFSWKCNFIWFCKIYFFDIYLIYKIYFICENSWFIWVKKVGIICVCCDI